jgi:hypothetical protein
MMIDEQKRLRQLMRESFVSLGDPDPPDDLWPKVLGRIHERPRLSSLDRTLLGALITFGLLAPRSILLLMYSL